MKDGRLRISIGAALIAAVAGIIAFDRSRATPVLGPAVAALLGLVALVEYLRVCGERMPGPVRSATILCGAALLVLPALSTEAKVAPFGAWLLGGFVATLLPVAGSLLGLRWRSGVQPADFGLLGLAWLGLAITALPMALLAVTMRARPEGMLFTCAVIFGSKLNDMGGYLVGSTLGRRPLCPGISPNKTWEGAAGGFVFGVAGTVAVVQATPLSGALGWGQAAVLGLGLGVLTPAGDLTESAFKRSMGVKDTAALIPAFGGVLDLLDSLIFAAPFGYTMAVLWLE